MFMAKAKRVDKREYNLSVIPDHDINGRDATEDRWNRTVSNRPDEDWSAYDREVWQTPVRVPSANLVRAISRYWREHTDIFNLVVYDMTMACVLRLQSSEGVHAIAGFEIVGDIDFCDDDYVEFFTQAHLYGDPGVLAWWDGTTLH